MDFSQEIQRYKMEQIVNKINIKNKQRYDEIQELNKNPENIDPAIHNFPLFLLQQGLAVYSKWFILNITVKEIHPFSQSLYEFTEDDIVFQCLLKYFSKKYLFLSIEERETLKSRL